jgi:glutamyl-tRNA reductase
MQPFTSPNHTPVLSYCVVGVNHRSLPIAQREKLSQIENKSPEFLPELARDLQVKEAALLSTCNRFEVIAVAEMGERLTQVPPRIIDYLRSKTGDQISAEHFYQLFENEAIRHVFRVSSSLDSLVLGEAQILGQVKACYERARTLGLADKHLHHLFQFAFRTAKKIRANTEIGAGAVSVSYVAVRLAEQILGDLEKRSVLVLGSGQMAELAVLHLKARGCSQITVANRTIERATELASRIGGTAMNLSAIEKAISEFDVVIGSLSIDKPIIETQKMKKVLGRKPQFFIDLGLPRNFPESIGSLSDVYLYTIDDLAKISDEHREIREQSQHDAEIMIEYGLLQFDRWLSKLSREPLILDLRSQIQETCMEELARHLDADPNRAQIIETLTHRLTQQISHRLIGLLQEMPTANSPHPEVVALFIEALSRKED